MRIQYRLSTVFALVGLCAIVAWLARVKMMDQRLFQMNEAIRSSQVLDGPQKELLANLLWQEEARRSGLLEHLGVRWQDPDPKHAGFVDILAHTVVWDGTNSSQDGRHRVFVCNEAIMCDGHTIILMDCDGKLVDWRTSAGMVKAVAYGGAIGRNRLRLTTARRHGLSDDVVDYELMPDGIIVHGEGNGDRSTGGKGDRHQI